jgi:hypothetical protein
LELINQQEYLIKAHTGSNWEQANWERLVKQRSNCTHGTAISVQLGGCFHSR